MPSGYYQEAPIYVDVGVYILLADNRKNIGIDEQVPEEAAQNLSRTMKEHLVMSGNIFLLFLFHNSLSNMYKVKG